MQQLASLQLQYSKTIRLEFYSVEFENSVSSEHREVLVDSMFAVNEHGLARNCFLQNGYFHVVEETVGAAFPSAGTSYGPWLPCREVKVKHFGNNFGENAPVCARVDQSISGTEVLAICTYDAWNNRLKLTAYTPRVGYIRRSQFLQKSNSYLTRPMENLAGTLIVSATSPLALPRAAFSDGPLLATRTVFPTERQSHSPTCSARTRGFFVSQKCAFRPATNFC